MVGFRKEWIIARFFLLVITLLLVLSVIVLSCTGPQKASTKPDKAYSTIESEGRLSAKPALSEWELK